MVSEKTTVTALKESYNDVVEKLLATGTCSGTYTHIHTYRGMTND